MAATMTDRKCPRCEKTMVQREEGCWRCKNCGTYISTDADGSERVLLGTSPIVAPSVVDRSAHEDRWARATEEDENGNY